MTSPLPFHKSSNSSISDDIFHCARLSERIDLNSAAFCLNTGICRLLIRASWYKKQKHRPLIRRSTTRIQDLTRGFTFLPHTLTVLAPFGWEVVTKLVAS
jgi:hypothetical protein